MTISLYRRSMCETEMRKGVIEAVERQGGKVLWLPDSRATAFADWPDLTIVLGDRLILVELKSWRRLVTPGQADMLARLSECRRVEAFVVRSEPRSAEEIGYQQFMDWLEGTRA